MSLVVGMIQFPAMAAVFYVSELTIPADRLLLGIQEGTLKIVTGSGLLVILSLSLFWMLNRKRPSIWRILFLVLGAQLTLMLTVPVLLPGLRPDYGVVVAVFLLGLLFTPVLYRLRLYHQEKIQAQNRLMRYSETQDVLNRLLAISVSRVPLVTLLEKALGYIFELPWLPESNQGGIFLYREERGVLDLTVQRNLDAPLLSLCSHVSLGHCLCGRAGLKKEIQHAACVDARHEICFEGMAPHGHYNVPLLLDNKLLGVMVLYLEHGHRRNDEEVAFLKSYGHTLALLIDRWRKSDMIKRLAFYDPLTGLANRALLEDHFLLVQAQARRAGKKFALLFFDLDNFKAINDTLGHTQGDELLKQVAERLRNSVRETDTVARLGGDEFIILLSSLKDSTRQILEDVGKVAEKIIAEITKPVILTGQEFHLGASIGIACFPNDGNNLSKLLQAADTAMYQAKQQGRGRFQFYTQSMNVRLKQRMEIERVLRKALEQKQFYLVYQPQFDIASGRIVGAEALLRWKHPVKGELSPADFVPIAESNGFIVELGEWILREACRQKALWKQAGLCWNLQHLAVNVSLRQLQSADFVSNLEKILTETGVKTGEVELEVTESAFIRRDDMGVVVNFERLKELGIRLAMDDFGTGYSSLGRLKQFPIDTLKIDRSFIRDLTSDPNDASITRAIVALGHSLNLMVLAEGVETEEQFVFLRQLGCDWLQGFYSGRPMSAMELVKLWADNSTFVVGKA